MSMDSVAWCELWGSSGSDQDCAVVVWSVSKQSESFDLTAKFPAFLDFCFYTMNP